MRVGRMLRVLERAWAVRDYRQRLVLGRMLLDRPRAVDVLVFEDAKPLTVPIEQAPR